MTKLPNEVKCKYCGNIFPKEGVIIDYVPKELLRITSFEDKENYTWGITKTSAFKCPYCNRFALEGFDPVIKDKKEEIDLEIPFLAEGLEYLEIAKNYKPLIDKLKEVLIMYKPYLDELTEYIRIDMVEGRIKIFKQFNEAGFTREESLQLTISTYNDFVNAVKKLSSDINTKKGGK
jgi:DNA-directed RNA polymerase subunit RPC12/RpoP